MHSPTVVNVRLYGKLGARFGRSHRMAVSNTAEAIRALGVMLPGFDAYMTQGKDRGEGYAVFYGKRNLHEKELSLPSNGQDIRIAPILLGAKEGGWFQVILGAVLIVAGYFLLWTPFGLPLINAGIGLVIGGVVQLLAPSPKGSNADDRPENQPSYAFNGPVNTQAQGRPVPVLYGEMIVGSAVLSAGINAVDQAYVPRGGTAGGSGGGGGGGAPGYYEEA